MKDRALSNFGSITKSPFSLIKPHLLFKQAAAKPFSVKDRASSNFGSITKSPFSLIKPYFILSFSIATNAKPFFEKGLTS